MLSACEPTATRPCAAFGLPLVDQWSTVDAIDKAATFYSAEGQMVTLTLSSREDSPPYTGHNHSTTNSNEVVCNMTSTRRYLLDDGMVSWLIKFTQRELVGQPLEEHGLSINMKLESPAGNTLKYGIGFIIRVGGGEPETYTDAVPNAEGEVTRRLTDVVVGGVQYKHAIEQIINRDLVAARSTNNPASAVVRVIIAEGGGLVQFEQLDGTVYTRSDSD